MSIPFICQTAMTQHAAASPSVPVSAAVAAAGMARVTTAGSAGTSVSSAAGNAAFCGSTFIVVSMISHSVLGVSWAGFGGPAGRPTQE